MNHVITDNTWEFGGLLSGLPGHVAWGAFGALALLGFIMAWWSYRHAVRPLSRGQRATLITLRTLFLATLLVCLANPVEVKKNTLEPTAVEHRLAVVVDRSDSMTTADNRGRTRLADALRTWQRIATGAQGAFAETNYYSLAKDLQPAPTLQAAAARTGDTGETWLYQSLIHLLDAPPNERPDSIVVLTDGLDTTTDRADRLVARALTERVTLYFVPGSNRLQPQPFVRVRELRAPISVLRNTQFNLDGTIEAFSADQRTVPYTLWRGKDVVASGNFNLSAGHNVLPWQTHVSAGDPGELELVLRLGTTADTPPVARTSTQVIAHEKIRVLFYQGALDWGFRYLTDALQTDPSFELTSLINPALHVTLTRSVNGAPSQMPSTSDGLKNYDFVILAHLFPSQLTPDQQQALIDFVRQGGGVLFTSPDSTALPQFSGQPISELVPVEFAPTGSVAAQAAADDLAQRLLEIRQLGSSGDSGASGSSAQLAPFTITAAGLKLPIFAQAGNKTPLTPRFSEYAPASSAKSGAEVLAVHPTAHDPTTREPYILLATEVFGRGRTAILTTDGLWRWKLSEPSTSHVVETFWQQLLLWLGEGRTHGARFVDAPAQVSVGDEVLLHVSGVSGAHAPAVTAIAPDGVSHPLIVQASGDPDAPWSCTWTAAAAGAWELRATGDDGTPTRTFLFAIQQPRGELAQTAPSIEQMRAIAESTRGALLDDSTPSTWKTEEAPPPTVVDEQRTMMWDRWPILALAFTAFALELCLRRRWRLL